MMATTRKRIVCCLDGTWNRPDQEGNPTNVTEFMRAVRAGDDAGIAQITFYGKGVGTGGPIDHLLGGLFGRGLDGHIRDAYRFLVNNYVAGDEIYLLGFSRGAFAARSLAGLIGEVGLLPDERRADTAAVWAAYRRPQDDSGRADAIRDLRRHSRCDVRIRALAVWDTVGALGIPDDLLSWHARKRYRFHNTSLGGHIDRAFHALATDERRGPFWPTLWRAPATDQYPLAGECDATDEPRQIVEQCWFAGVHSDVGGGYDHNALSRAPLAWMIDRIVRTTDLALRPEYRTFNTRQDALAPQHESRDPTYLASRFLPGLRVLAGVVADTDWLRSVRARRRMADIEQPAINELVHRAALDRRGREVGVITGRRRRDYRTYAPINLEAALRRLPVVEHDGLITRAPNTM